MTVCSRQNVFKTFVSCRLDWCDHISLLTSATSRLGNRERCVSAVGKLVCGYLSLVWSYQNIPAVYRTRVAFCLAHNDKRSSLGLARKSSSYCGCCKKQGINSTNLVLQDDRGSRLHHYRSDTTAYRLAELSVMRECANSIVRRHL